MVGSFLILPILISSFRKSEMKIIKQLWWFFRLEKKRYVMGIVSLCLVSALNLLPPYIMGEIIDQIAGNRLSGNQLLIGVAGLVLSAIGMGTSKNTSRASRASNLSLIYSLFLVNFCL